MPKRCFDQIDSEDCKYINRKFLGKKPRVEEEVVEQVDAGPPDFLDFLGAGDKVMVRDNHIYYYEKIGMNSWYKSPEKDELINKIINIYGPLVKDPSMINGPYGFNNIKFK